jgi:hypothetical protein
MRRLNFAAHRPPLAAKVRVGFAPKTSRGGVVSIKRWVPVVAPCERSVYGCGQVVLVAGVKAQATASAQAPPV